MTKRTRFYCIMRQHCQRPNRSGKPSQRGARFLENCFVHAVGCKLVLLMRRVRMSKRTRVIAAQKNTISIVKTVAASRVSEFDGSKGSSAFSARQMRGADCSSTFVFSRSLLSAEYTDSNFFQVRPRHFDVHGRTAELLPLPPSAFRPASSTCHTVPLDVESHLQLDGFRLDGQCFLSRTFFLTSSTFLSYSSWSIFNSRV